MRKLRLNLEQLNNTEVLTRSQLRNVLGGSTLITTPGGGGGTTAPGDGGGDDDTGCGLPSSQSCNNQQNLIWASGVANCPNGLAWICSTNPANVHCSFCD